MRRDSLRHRVWTGNPSASESPVDVTRAIADLDEVRSRLASVQRFRGLSGPAALASGQIDLKECYTTDAKIAELDLVTLEDDLHFFPQYQAVFLYRLDAPEKAIAAIRSLEGQISETRMIGLNRKAEDARNYASAAADFFAEDNNRSLEAPKRRKFLSLLAPIPCLRFANSTVWAIAA